MSLTDTITEGTLDGVLIEEFTQFYRDECAAQLNEIIHHDSPSLTIDYDVLHEYDEDLADGLVDDPIEYYYSAREALRSVATRDDADTFIDGAPYDPVQDDDADDPNPLAYADLRIINNPNMKTVRELRADDVTTMVSIEGRVKKKTQVQPRVDVAVFKCTTCGDLHYEEQPLVGQMDTRDECANCNSQTVFDWHESHHVNFERLEIEESPEGLSGGETPETIEFYNRGDTAGRVNPGERVTVTGILEPASDDDQGGPEVIFDTRLNGNNIVREEEAFEDIEITDEDIQTIKDLANSDDIYDKVQNSIAPAIYGYEMQKFALALSLFGGVKKEVSGSYVRGDIHTIAVGDPGTAKTASSDTLLLDSNNCPITIESFVERHMDDPERDEDGDLIDTVDEYVEVPSLGPNGQVEKRPVEAVWKKQAPDGVYEVVTESGKRITVTDTHPLFTHNGAGDVEQMKVGDMEEGMSIATPRRLPDAGVDNSIDHDYNPAAADSNATPLNLPTEWTPWFAKLIGLCIAEGHQNEGHVEIRNEDEELLDVAREGLESLGLNPTSKELNRTVANEVRCSSVELYKFLESIEEDIVKKSSERSVPDSLFNASEEIRRAFVKAYVDGECHPEHDKPEMNVSSGSRKLLEGVQTLLLSLDIRSQIHSTKTPDGYDDAYQLRLTGDDYRRYVEEVGFISERKEEMAEPEERLMSNTNTDVIPRGGELIRDIRETLAMAQGDLGLPRTTVLGYENEGKDPARNRAEVAAEAFQRRLDELDQIAGRDGDWTWAQVSSVRANLGLSQDDAAAPASFAGGGVSYHERNNPEEVADDVVVEHLRETAQEMYEEAVEQVHEFYQLAHSDIKWERIERIEEVDYDHEWMYDLQVEGTHAYIGNNIFNHNSQLLEYAHDIAPRGVYTSGKGSSAAGLTASAVQEESLSGETTWTLEAGALPLADQGVAAIDEIDKMDDSDRDSLHEALESQTISINKAGINATLKARASVMAAANPKYGQFDPYEAVSEQVELDPALISRFDLIFTITDDPDEDMDKAIAEHIVKTNQAEQQDEPDDDVTAAIEPDLFRKYIAYARNNCFPTLPDEVGEELEDYYVELRQKGDEGVRPATARQLQGLIRLAEASARIRLSDTVEMKDAELAKNVIEASMEDVAMDPETGQLDADIVEGGMSSSQSKRLKTTKRIIETLQDEFDEGVPKEEIFDMVSDNDENVTMDALEDALEQLRREGEIYEPRENQYKVMV